MKAPTVTMFTLCVQSVPVKVRSVSRTLNYRVHGRFQISLQQSTPIKSLKCDSSISSQKCKTKHKINKKLKKYFLCWRAWSGGCPTWNHLCFLISSIPSFWYPSLSTGFSRQNFFIRFDAFLNHNSIKLWRFIGIKCLV